MLKQSKELSWTGAATTVSMLLQIFTGAAQACTGTEKITSAELEARAQEMSAKICTRSGYNPASIKIGHLKPMQKQNILRATGLPGMTILEEPADNEGIDWKMAVVCIDPSNDKAPELRFSKVALPKDGDNIIALVVMHKTANEKETGQALADAAYGSSQLTMSYTFSREVALHYTVRENSTLVSHPNGPSYEQPQGVTGRVELKLGWPSEREPKCSKVIVVDAPAP